MDAIYIKEEDIKHITEHLLEKKLIFHPSISPNGIMDFSMYGDRKYILLLDRNLLTKMIEFFQKGVLNDPYIRKIIACIMFWAHLNNISLNSGLALNEYANYKNSNKQSSLENNIFLDAMNFYHPMIWLSIAMGRSDVIKPIPNISTEKYFFKIDNEHYLMHASELFCIARLYLDEKLSKVDKMINFLEWNFENLLICQYTIVYALYVFAGKSKILSKIRISNTEDIFKDCKNQAWDLTYLSFWSTLYWTDRNEESVYLFATMDKELKRIIVETHDNKNNLFSRFFNKEDAQKIEDCYKKLNQNRKKPELNESVIRDLYDSECRKLGLIVKNFG